MSRKSKTLIWLLLISVLIVLSGLVGILRVGSDLATPAHRNVGPPPANLPATSVELTTEAGTRLQGWLVQGDPDRGSVLLLHGIRADRRSMLGRALFLMEHGYTVLLIDHQAHGESDGEYLTFGHLESRDAAVAVRYLRELNPGQPVAALGSSLGGAACLLGAGPVEVDALILEAVYPDIETAIANRLRMRFGSPGALLTPLLTVQLEYRLGISTEDLRPVQRISSVTCPVLIVSGTEDRRTRPADTQRLFHAAPEPKELLLIQGARHVDLHRQGGEEYADKILEFLDHSFGGQLSGGGR